MSTSTAPAMGLITCHNNQKCYAHELAKTAHFRIVEFPKVVADWVKLVSDWVGHTGFFTDAAASVSKGFSKIMSAESLLYLAGDICELPSQIAALKNRVIDLETAKEWTSSVMMDVAHEVRRLACLIGGTVADWYEAIEFFQNVKVIGKNFKAWFMPSEVVAKIGGMMSAASNMFDIGAGYTTTQIQETEDEAANEVKKQVALQKDNADLVQWSAIFAINAVGLAALALGVTLAPVVTVGLCTTIFASRLVSHYKHFELDSLNSMDPKTIAATADLTR